MPQGNNTLLILIYCLVGAIVCLIIAFLMLQLKQKKMYGKEMKKIKALRQGVKQKSFDVDILFQKLYIYYVKIPFLKTYLKKMRRKIEILYLQDEYRTRKASAQVITRGIIIAIIIAVATIILTKSDLFLMVACLILEIFIIDSLMAGTIDKMDTKLIKQQIEFFAEIRHSYNETKMVEEAIYETSQNDELEVSKQGEKIYEILISDDPETELEKYYDIAPNIYLKEFAGLSYLTKEFGDRTENNASLYLKNLNNITEEMQIEIIKRDKLDYVFQSLSVISIVPIFILPLLKSWCLSNFYFTASFYNGKGGLLVQIASLILTIICYVLTRKLKDSGSIKDENINQEKVWQMKLYKKPIVKSVMDRFIPKKNTKEYRLITKLMKDSAVKQKIETFYVNRVLCALVAGISSFVLIFQAHKIAKDFVYKEPTSEYDIVTEMTATDAAKGMEITNRDNEYIEMLKGDKKITVEEIKSYISKTPYYLDKTEEIIQKDADRLLEKLEIINKESFSPLELLLACAIMVAGYWIPKWLIMFQKKLRVLSMENEVMQFQTIIRMLMKIERVNVEIILEWIERYANIFKEQVTRCVNNYEAGAWEALENFKSEVSLPQLVRIIESLQAAVEKIPIAEAFDELETEREYYKEKRKESNEVLIKKKGMIGKVIGFAPMIAVFVGYLIVPLIMIGMSAMTDSFASLSTL